MAADLVHDIFIKREKIATAPNALKKGDIINLEKSLEYGERISGHFVQGHVDTTSIVKKIIFIGKFLHTAVIIILSKENFAGHPFIPSP